MKRCRLQDELQFGHAGAAVTLQVNTAAESSQETDESDEDDQGDQGNQDVEDVEGE